jgi:hypothetical protein
MTIVFERCATMENVPSRSTLTTLRPVSRYSDSSSERERGGYAYARSSNATFGGAIRRLRPETNESPNIKQTREET